MARYIPPHPKKGSPEAKAWGAKMRKARAGKIRHLGRIREEEFFGKMSKDNPRSPRYDLVCTANGCVFLKEGLTKKAANLEGGSHANLYQHSVSVVRHTPKAKRNPGAAFHEGMARVAEKYRRTAPTATERHFYKGVEVAHRDSAKASRRVSQLNPSDYRTWTVIVGTRTQPKVLRKTKRGIEWQVQKEATAWRVLKRQGELVHSVGEFVTLPEALNVVDRSLNNPLAVFSLPPNPGRRHGKFRSCVKKVRRSLRKYRRPGDPKAICGAALNPPRSVRARVAGVVYNDVHEVRAEKTAHPRLKGRYKHPFKRASGVKLLALDNGDLLLHSTRGKPLWERA